MFNKDLGDGIQIKEIDRMELQRFMDCFRIG